MPITPKYPLSLDDKYLYETLEDILLITRFHVKNIILTNPGEKISDPLFGVGIRRYLFENLTRGATSNIRAKIGQQLAKYLPHVEILSIQVNTALDTPYHSENSLTLKLSYYIPEINQSDILSFDISNSTAIY